MKKKTVLFLSFLIASTFTFAQTVSGKLKFGQGQIFEIEMKTNSTISQQAMGQAIDFTVNASANHSYTATNATDDNTTLRHEIQRINFAFDGMGQKQKFDSENEKDLKGPFGKPVKDMMEKKYDMIIDPLGNVMMAFPEKITLAEGDSRMAIITNMLKGVMDLVQPPKKGKGSFFNVLPDTISAVGSTWNTTAIENGGNIETEYKIAEINDTTIVIDFIENSSSVAKAEMMGNPTTTKLKNKSTGKIILDRATNIVQEKSFTTESTGSTETSFGDLPVTSKTTTKIVLKAK
ncbi:MAG: DUF6263 family protein [Chitinophagaceae bacterium]